MSAVDQLVVSEEEAGKLAVSTIAKLCAVLMLAEEKNPPASEVVEVVDAILIQYAQMLFVAKGGKNVH